MALPSHNVPEYTVSEISQSLKRTLEDNFSWVRVKGEVTGFKQAASGHLYFTLKDTQAVIDAVCWKGIANKLTVSPEDGLEIICSGKITTFSGRSRYQIVVEDIEIAGEGALLKLIEDRKKRLAAEGLFDQNLKKPLPFLPSLIAVVTSPTGAVIRDILHRIEDRFPTRVLVWPVLVQGDGAHEKIADAVDKLNDPLIHEYIRQKPDLIIVARGGGSIEDLMPFNEETVIRSVFNSTIPVISAVGHETDWTLIDYVSDYRAPTPTAAAEKAVPVLHEILLSVQDSDRRLYQSIQRYLSELKLKLDNFSAYLPNLNYLIDEYTQKIDERYERLTHSIKTYLQSKKEIYSYNAVKLTHPKNLIEKLENLLMSDIKILDSSIKSVFLKFRQKFVESRSKLNDKNITYLMAQYESQMKVNSDLLHKNISHILERKSEKLEQAYTLLDTVSHKSVLKRGFVFVQDSKGKVVSSVQQLKDNMILDLSFQDGKAQTKILGKNQSVKKNLKAKQSRQQGEFDL